MVVLQGTVRFWKSGVHSNYWQQFFCYEISKALFSKYPNFCISNYFLNEKEISFKLKNSKHITSVTPVVWSFYTCSRRLVIRRESWAYENPQFHLWNNKRVCSIRKSSHASTLVFILYNQVWKLFYYPFWKHCRAEPFTEWLRPSSLRSTIFNTKKYKTLTQISTAIVTLKKKDFTVFIRLFCVNNCGVRVVDRF